MAKMRQLGQGIGSCSSGGGHARRLDIGGRDWTRGTR